MPGDAGKEREPEKGATVPEPGTEEAAAAAQRGLYDFSDLESIDDAVAQELAAEKKAEDAGGVGEESAEEGDSRTDEGGAEEEPILLDPDLVAQAQALGLSAEDFRAFADDDRLKRVVALLTARKAAGEGEKAEAGKKDEAAEFDFNLDPETYDPELVNQLKAFGTHHRDTVKALKAEMAAQAAAVTGLNEQARRQQDEVYFRRFDTAINSREDLKSLLGKGRGDEMDQKSDQFKKRLQVLRHMDAAQAGRAAVGLDALSFDDCLEQAVGNVFKDHKKQQARQEVAAKVKARAGQTIARPTQRQMRESDDPEVRARRTVARMLQDIGAGEESDADALGLPT